MRSFQNLPVARKLTATTVLICGVALAIAFTCVGLFDRSAYREDTSRDFAILADEFDDNVASGLLFSDATATGQTLSTLEANPHILAAAVYDQAGNLFVS